MLTPKEKAIDIVDKIQLDSRYEMIPTPIAKIIGLKTVDEIVEALSYRSLNDSPYTTLEARQFYIKVKQEINKL